MHPAILIILLAAFPALSTDMYLPAIPALQTLWSIPLSQASRSLTAFFLSFSICLLIHGPLSDRFGRRPVLLRGVALYIAGSWLCAASASITMLVAARMIQAAGAAAAAALSFALARDLYSGMKRQKLLAYIGVLVPLCPMAAPLLGGWMLRLGSWRWIFLTQGTLALLVLYGCFRMKEPLDALAPGGVRSMLRRYAALLRNRRFTAYTLAFSCMSMGFFAFVGGSASIYITTFGQSEQAYGLWFGFNALGLMAGSFACSRLCASLPGRRILGLSLWGVAAGGAALMATGGSSPLLFALPMLTISFFLGVSRPVSNHMILEQVPRDAGMASSLMTFSFFLFGALSMECIALDWESRPLVIGALSLLGAFAPLAALRLLRGGDEPGSAPSR